MNTTTKWIVGIVVVALIIWLGISASKDKVPTETGPIKIGFIGPLTGDAVTVGEPISNGVRLAEKEINDAGGIDGRLVQVIYEDGKCSGKDAASAAQKLITIDGVKFIVGGICSSEAFGYAPITEAAHILTIAPGASAPDMSGLGDYVFRTAVSDVGRGIVMAEYVADLYDNVAIVTEKTDYTSGLKEVFVKKAAELQLPIVSDEDLVDGATDYRSVLSKVKNSNADALFINVQTEASLIRVAQQARDLGITVPFIASEANGPGVAAAGPAVEGMVVAVAPGLAKDGRGAELTEKYQTMFGVAPAYPFYVGAAYDALYLITQGIDRYGKDTEKVKEYLYDLKDYDGTIGKYSFDVQGDIEGVTFVFQKVVNGTFVDL